MKRSNLGVVVADRVEKEILAGRISGVLPSTRNLSEMLQVSRPTVLSALTLLAEKGIVARSGTQRYQTNESLMRRVEKGGSRERHALFLLDQEIVRRDAFQIFIDLSIRLRGKGWRLSSLHLNFGHSENRPVQWSRAVAGYGAEKAIVWSGRQHLGEWLVDSGIPALFIGGTCEGLPIPCIGTLASKCFETILEQFIGQGHERIWFPMCNRPDPYASRLADRVEAFFRLKGLPFAKRWNMPESPYRGPDLILHMFNEAWQRFQPTAIMLHDWREYIAVSAGLRRIGLEIPRDISVAVIGDDPEMQWHRPALAHFKSPLKRMVNSCASWLLSPNPAASCWNQCFEAEWHPGESIGPVWR